MGIDFLWIHFFPDEPISRSIGMTRNWFTDTMYLKDSLNDGSSIAAIDKDGNIIGARLGKRVMRSQWHLWFMEKLFDAIIIIVKLFSKLDLDVWKIFDEPGCEMVYMDAAVCAARTSGVKGLGTELCRRSEVLARELGCTHTLAAVTGKYSRRIFEKLGHTILSEVVYDEFRDQNGELYLKDTREHKSIISCLKELK